MVTEYRGAQYSETRPNSRGESVVTARALRRMNPNGNEAWVESCTYRGSSFCPPEALPRSCHACRRSPTVVTGEFSWGRIPQRHEPSADTISAAALPPELHTW